MMHAELYKARLCLAALDTPPASRWGFVLVKLNLSLSFSPPLFAIRFLGGFLPNYQE